MSRGQKIAIGWSNVLKVNNDTKYIVIHICYLYNIIKNAISPLDQPGFLSG